MSAGTVGQPPRAAYSRYCASASTEGPVPWSFGRQLCERFADAVVLQRAFEAVERIEGLGLDLPCRIGPGEIGHAVGEVGRVLHIEVRQGRIDRGRFVRLEPLRRQESAGHILPSLLECGDIVEPGIEAVAFRRVERPTGVLPSAVEAIRFRSTPARTAASRRMCASVSTAGLLLRRVSRRQASRKTGGFPAARRSPPQSRRCGFAPVGCSIARRRGLRAIPTRSTTSSPASPQQEPQSGVPFSCPPPSGRARGVPRSRDVHRSRLYVSCLQRSTDAQLEGVLPWLHTGGRSKRRSDSLSKGLCGGGRDRERRPQHGRGGAPL